MLGRSVLNEIKILRSQELYRGDESVGVIQLGINFEDYISIESFMDNVVQEWISQRMQSVPHTKIMIVTIQGIINAVEFKNMWNQHRMKNGMLDFFMKIMVSADVMHIHGNELIDRDSLI